MIKSQLLDKLIILEYQYRSTKYAQTVDEAYRYFNSNRLDLCEKSLSSIPSEEVLLESLVDQLKGKSVYRTIKKLEEQTNPFIKIKALSSLITHAAIGCEHGDIEYKILIPRLLEKIQNILSET